MPSSAEQRRAWVGAPLWSFGFRPFFLGGAFWASAAMILWVAMLLGWQGLPMRLSPLDWHAHEFLFGYLPAALSGFLLTAIPNWTGRYPILGKPLMALFLLWIAGRVVMLCGALLPTGVDVLVEASFLVVLALVIGREVLAGRNWRNLKVLGLVGLLAGANLIFYYELMTVQSASGGVGARVATATAIMLIVVIGGRIVPSFTRNWLMKHAPGVREPASFGLADRVTMVLSALALVGWSAAPDQVITALACAIAGICNAVRLMRWQGWQSRGEPLVWILHVGYLFVPLGFLLTACSIVFPEVLANRASQHSFMVGAVGVMTLAVMTRASLGHTGRMLRASRAVTGIYILAVVAAFARVFAGISGAPVWLLHVAAVSWILAFLGFVVVYAPILAGPRPR
jgi:uncharacterized protein involved in response to NO